MDKTIGDLTDKELLIVFRGPDSPLDAFDLVNLELVCKRWWVLTAMQIVCWR